MRNVRQEEVELLDEVCNHLGISLGSIFHRPGARAHQKIVEARMLAAWLLRAIHQLSYPMIAKVLRLKSHKDVLRLLRRMQEEPDLIGLAADLWFELDPPLAILDKVQEFEHGVGLHLVTTSRTKRESRDREQTATP